MCIDSLKTQVNVVYSYHVERGYLEFLSVPLIDST